VQGRNVLFTSDSTTPICRPTDCEVRKACRRGSDCPAVISTQNAGGANIGIPRFCARRCVSGDCPIIGTTSTRFLGFPDINPDPVDTVAGYGICQDCWDCVYDDEVYPEHGVDPSQLTCNIVCATLTPDLQGIDDYYGICPGCNSVLQLMRAYNNSFASGNGLTLPADFNAKPRNRRDEYRRCTTDAQCNSATNLDENGQPPSSTMWCAISCDSAISTLASKPGMAEYCNEDETVYPGGMSALNAYIAADTRGKREVDLYGYCQPCSGSCSPERIFENFDNQYAVPNALELRTCVEACNDACPRCLMDKMCATEAFPLIPAEFGANPSLIQSGYQVSAADKGTYLDINDNAWTLFAVPNTAYTENIGSSYQAQGQTVELDENSRVATFAPTTSGIGYRFLQPHPVSRGPYPKAGCWYDPSYPESEALAREYLACLQQDGVLRGIISPSQCG
jgi:hypothetical protein